MNLEEIKQDKLNQLKERQETQQQISQIENMAKQMLSQKSWERYTNIKIADQETSLKILGIIASAIQQGVNKIEDMQFIELLKTLDPKKETKIKFMRK